MTIAVVILNWNGIELLKKFLPSVIEFSPEATVYVADNASTDASVNYLEDNFSGVEIIRNKINGGFAKGYNDALASLKEDVFILLNNDVQVTPHWLVPLIDIFKKDPKTGAVQPKILDYKDPEYFEYAGAAGGFLDRLGYPYCRGRIFESVEKDLGQYDDEKEIFWASGACMAIKREAFYQIGAFDQDYFAHQEEIDVCWRLKNFGYSVKFTASSVVFHVGGATLNYVNPRKTFYNFRNSLYNLIKNLPTSSLWWVLPFRMILDGVAALKFLLEGKGNHFSAIFKAHIDFYKMLPVMLNKRNSLPRKKFKFDPFSIVFKHYIWGNKKTSKFKG